MKKVFTPTKEGLKVAAVRKGRTGLVMTFADESSWQTVVRSQKLKDNFFFFDGADRTIEKEVLACLPTEVHQ